MDNTNANTATNGNNIPQFSIGILIGRQQTQKKGDKFAGEDNDSNEF